MEIYPNRKIFFVLALFFTGTMPQKLYSQKMLPVNSNLLVEYGISPKVLDAALSSTLQEGAYREEVYLQKIGASRDIKASFQLVYDRSFKDGIDIRVIYDPDSLREIKNKDLLKVMQEMHSFSRLSNSNLYDEKSLKIISYSDEEVVLSFLYDKARLEPELRYGKKLAGKIYIRNKELERVELVNTKPIKFLTHKIEAGEFKSTSYFTRVEVAGGHIESSSIDLFSYDEKGKRVSSSIRSSTLEYKDNSGMPVRWKDMPVDISLNNPKELVGSLGGPLPLMGKGAKKLGYKLPRPIGLNIFSHHQKQILEFTDLAVGGSSTDLTSLNNLFNLENSKVNQITNVTMVKGDVWLLPFLNIMGVVGTGTNTIDGALFLDEEFKETLTKLGFLVGLEPQDIPDFLPIKSDLSALTYGGGVTLAGGVGDFNITVNYQIVASAVIEANTNKVAQVVSPAIGYMTPFGMNIMVGAQGQFYNTATRGFIGLPNEKELHYRVDFKPIRWNLMAGLYVPISNHFELAIQTGWGDRQSITAVFGYRF